MNLEDRLTYIWKYIHSEKHDDAEKEKQCAKNWQFIQEKLKECLKANPPPGIRSKIEREDAVSDFLCSFFNEEFPGRIKSFALLKSKLKKYLAKKYNPVQYELDCILRNALLSLEKDEKVKRDSSRLGKKISPDTCFALINETGSERLIADFATYEYNAHLVSNVTCKIRNNDPMATKIITPTIACELVLNLLSVFNGWTRESDLLKAMMRHIPEQLIINSSLYDDKSNENDNNISSADRVIDLEADNDILDYDAAQVFYISGEIANSIWENICKISTDSFCLYYLPKEFFSKKVVAREIGAKSTINDHAKKIERVFRNHYRNFDQYTPSSPRGKQVITFACEKILKFLSGRCTEKGHSPHLYTNE